MENKTFEEIKFDLMKEDQKILVKKLYDGGYDKAAAKIFKRQETAKSKEQKCPRGLWAWLFYSEEPAPKMLLIVFAIGIMLVFISVLAIHFGVSAADKLAFSCIGTAFAAAVCCILAIRCSACYPWWWEVSLFSFGAQIIVSSEMFLGLKKAAGAEASLLNDLAVITIALGILMPLFFMVARLAVRPAANEF